MAAILHISDSLNISAVENAVAESLSRIRNHPFILKAHCGELTKEQTLRWVFCAGRESRTFPKILENMLASCAHPMIRSVLEENLNDE